MGKRRPSYKGLIVIGIIMIALGIVFHTSLSESSPSLGTVFFGVGVLFLIMGMSQKKRDKK